jgi:hypothetical protein
MNQSLNHIVLLYKCNCIRTMSINTIIKTQINMTLLHHIHIPNQAMVSENDNRGFG